MVSVAVAAPAAEPAATALEADAGVESAAEDNAAAFVGDAGVDSADETAAEAPATDAPAKVEPPAALSGSLSKFSSSGTVKRWSKRNFVLSDGRLHWSKEQLPLGFPFIVHDRSYIDLSKTPCKVVSDDGGAGQLKLQPLSGWKWSRSDSNSRAGTAEALLLNVGEKHELWVHNLRRHIAWARSRAAERARQSDVRMGLILAQHNDLVEARDSQQECQICLMELVCDGDKQPVVRTPCNHVFHQKCLRRWLRKASKKPSCPSCRTEFCRDRRRG